MFTSKTLSGVAIIGALSGADAFVGTGPVSGLTLRSGAVWACRARGPLSLSMSGDVSDIMARLRQMEAQAAGGAPPASSAPAYSPPAPSAAPRQESAADILARMNAMAGGATAYSPPAQAYSPPAPAAAPQRESAADILARMNSMNGAAPAAPAAPQYAPPAAPQYAPPAAPQYAPPAAPAAQAPAPPAAPVPKAETTTKKFEYVESEKAKEIKARVRREYAWFFEGRERK